MSDSATCQASAPSASTCWAIEVAVWWKRTARQLKASIAEPGTGVRRSICHLVPVSEVPDRRAGHAEARPGLRDRALAVGDRLGDQRLDAVGVEAPVGRKRRRGGQSTAGGERAEAERSPEARPPHQLRFQGPGVNSRSAGDTVGAGARLGVEAGGGDTTCVVRAPALCTGARSRSRARRRATSRVWRASARCRSRAASRMRASRLAKTAACSATSTIVRAGTRHRHNLRIVMSGGGIPTEGEEHHHGEDRKPEEPRQRSRGHDRAEARYTDRGARATRITPPGRRSALRSAGPASRARSGGLGARRGALCALGLERHEVGVRTEGLTAAPDGRAPERGPRQVAGRAPRARRGQGERRRRSRDPGPSSSRSTPPSSFAISPPSPYARLTECGKLMIASRERNAQAMKSSSRASSQAPLGRSD